MSVVPMQFSQRFVAKATLMIAVRDRIDQLKAAKQNVVAMAKVSQPRISSLMNGQIDKFSIDSLVDIAERLGLSVAIAATTPVSSTPTSSLLASS